MLQHRWKWRWGIRSPLCNSRLKPWCSLADLWLEEDCMNTRLSGNTHGVLAGLSLALLVIVFLLIEIFLGWWE